MASSQDKAIALKDAYVNGIMDGAVEQKAADTAEAFAQMPGQDMGDVATVFADLDAGTVTGRNDGLDNVIITRGGQQVTTKHPGARTPPGTQNRSPAEPLTVPMNAGGFPYYNDKFNEAQATDQRVKGQQQAWYAESSAPSNNRQQAVREFQNKTQQIIKDYNNQMQQNYNNNRMRTITPNGFGGYSMY